ncbi:MAG: amidase family protein [Spiroplasma sp.]|nr:amidase family protein [Spiroplasma sp.]
MMKINNYQKLSIVELHQLLVRGEINPEDLISAAIKRMKKFNHLNAVVSSFPKDATKKAKNLSGWTVATDNLLFGIPFVLKDNIATIGQKTTACSNILANFIPNYDSTVNRLLKEVHAINLAKTALDELGMGGDGLYANTGYVYNPWNVKHITGGSSSGSAALVAAGVVPFSIGTDTGDSIRKPAAFCGVIGYKPTFGLISRNGVFPYAPSLDTVGILANHVADVAIVLDTLVKKDDQDATSITSNENNYFKNLTDQVSGLKVAVLNYDFYHWNKSVKTTFDQLMTKLTNYQVQVDHVNFDHDLLAALLPVYMIISFAEATSCHASLDGINFGVRKPGKNYQETMIKTRSSGFGNVVKRRYVIGSYALSEGHQKELFLKAKKVRRLIVQALEQLFAKYDAFIVMPSSNPAPPIKTTLKKTITLPKKHDYVEDLLLLANFNGSPSITIPLTTVDDLPIGITINAAPFKDQIALNLAQFLSNQINFKNKLLGEEDE